MFKTEADLRRWVTDQGWGTVWWVENKGGGSFGFSDAVIARGGKAAFPELKLAKLDRKGQMVITVRHKQRDFLRAMGKAGVPSGILAGVKGTDRVVRCMFQDLELKPMRDTGKLRTAAEYYIRSWADVEPGWDIFGPW